MADESRFAPGDKVVKLIAIRGREVAAIVKVVAVDESRGLVSTDESHVSCPEDIEADGVQTYRMSDGRATVNYIPGCTSRLVPMDGDSNG